MLLERIRRLEAAARAVVKRDSDATEAAALALVGILERKVDDAPDT